MSCLLFQRKELHCKTQAERTVWCRRPRKDRYFIMKACYENCQQDFGGIIMGKILDERFNLRDTVRGGRDTGGKSGLLRTDRTADRAG
mgnify:CR=1 FL=1